MISYEPNQKAEDIVYAAAFILSMPVFMTGKTLVTVPKIMRAPIAPHITLAYNPSQNFLDSFSVGEEYDIWVEKILSNALAVVAHVGLGEEIPFQGKYPHLTIAHHPDVSPVYSNELLKKFYEDGSLNVIETDPSAVDGYIAGIGLGAILVKLGTWRKTLTQAVAEVAKVAISHE